MIDKISLSVLYTMLEKWEAAAQSRDPGHDAHIEASSTFRYYCICFVNFPIRQYILEQLNQDNPVVDKLPTYDTTKNKDAFAPRIKALKQTIARLETEVARNIETII